GPDDHPFSFDAPEAADGKSTGATKKSVDIKLPEDVAAKMAAGVVAKTSSDAPYVETTDVDLAAALKTLAANPTVANECAVAEIYGGLGIYDRAADHLSAALKLDPKSAAAYDGLARTWRDWGLPEYAVADAYRAIAFAPRSAEAHNTLGTVLFALGDLTAARTQFSQAHALDPSAAYALNNLCYVAFVEGDHTQARAECAAALETMPTLTAAKQTLDALAAAPLIVK